MNSYEYDELDRLHIPNYDYDTNPAQPIEIELIPLATSRLLNQRVGYILTHDVTMEFASNPEIVAIKFELKRRGFA